MIRQPSLKELEARWREHATADKAKSREINERLQRGETVTMTARTIGSIEGFVEFADYRERCADEIAAVREAMRAEVETWLEVPCNHMDRQECYCEDARAECARRILRFIEGEP